MKINYETHPILAMLNDGSIEGLPVFDSDIIDLDLFTHHFSVSAPFFRKEINFIARPFAEAAHKAVDSLMAFISKESYDNGIDVSGTYVIGNYVYMLDYHCGPKESNKTVSFFAFYKKGPPVMLRQTLPDGKAFNWISQECISGRAHNAKINTKEEQEIAMEGAMFRCLVYAVFKKYATVETKLLPAGQKTKGVLCDYRNGTNMDVIMLDSRWFTRLVKSDAFKVRGHFRLQPKKKEGEWTKELIWIDEFQKEGYTAPARMLK